MTAARLADRLAVFYAYTLPFLPGLVAVEQARVIDLLPDRSARGFAAWLGGQGDVEIISRDRCGLYADGARQGAPAALQITDRHHLMTSLAEALERDVQRLQIEARNRAGRRPERR